jgi:hypothetical protein
MAALCLAEDLMDLKQRLGRMLVALTADGKPVTADALGVTGAMAALLRDAIHPNLVQTMEGTPALVHGGPFANIAHGCNSVLATRLALKLGDICLTEAGFATDLGAEKFFDIKCRLAGLKPDAAMIELSTPADLPPASVQANRKVFRATATARRARSLVMLSIPGTRPRCTRTGASSRSWSSAGRSSRPARPGHRPPPTGHG